MSVCLTLHQQLERLRLRRFKVDGGGTRIDGGGRKLGGGGALQGSFFIVGSESSLVEPPGRPPGGEHRQQEWGEGKGVVRGRERARSVLASAPLSFALSLSLPRPLSLSFVSLNCPQLAIVPPNSQPSLYRIKGRVGKGVKRVARQHGARSRWKCSSSYSFLCVVRCCFAVLFCSSSHRYELRTRVVYCSVLFVHSHAAGGWGGGVGIRVTCGNTRIQKQTSLELLNVLLRLGTRKLLAADVAHHLHPHVAVDVAVAVLRGRLLYTKHSV